jgi:uncharacterized protein YndB with AHSA1/START domain
MPDTPNGTLEQTENGYVIRFERFYPSPVEAVWLALTEPEQMKHWSGAGEFEVVLVEGGRLVSRVTGPPELVETILAEGGPLETADTILRVEAPSLLEHTFNGSSTSVVRWELSQEPGGCLLRLTHTEGGDTEGTQQASFLAGWHDLLDSIGEVLAGTKDTASWSLERWETYKQRYSEQLGDS